MTAAYPQATKEMSSRSLMLVFNNVTVCWFHVISRTLFSHLGRLCVLFSVVLTLFHFIYDCCFVMFDWILFHWLSSEAILVSVWEPAKKNPDKRNTQHPNIFQCSQMYNFQIEKNRTI